MPWFTLCRECGLSAELSAEFFNTHGEEIMENKEDIEEVRVGRHNNDNLRFADDAALILD